MFYSTVQFLTPTVLPKQNAVFTFAVPLYSICLPSQLHNHDVQIPPPPPNRAIAPESFTPILDHSSASQKLETVLDIDHIQFQLYGNQFRFRSAERAGRKFKHKETIEL